MMILQLSPVIPLLVRVKGEWLKAMAHLMIDYGIEHDVLWICFVDATGECWTLSNKDIRIQTNLTLGRTSL